jgi:hypothetical protein
VPRLKPVELPPMKEDFPAVPELTGPKKRGSKSKGP